MREPSENDDIWTQLVTIKPYALLQREMRRVVAHSGVERDETVLSMSAQESWMRRLGL